MTHSVKVTFVGNSSADGYVPKSTATEFWEYYQFNQMTMTEVTTAIAANDTTGLWAIHGSNIQNAWDTAHTFTFDSSTQTQTFIIDWVSEDVYNHWQTIRNALDFSDEDFEDWDLTYQYLTKSEEVL